MDRYGERVQALSAVGAMGDGNGAVRAVGEQRLFRGRDGVWLSCEHADTSVAVGSWLTPSARVGVLQCARVFRGHALAFALLCAFTSLFADVYAREGVPVYLVFFVRAALVAVCAFISTKVAVHGGQVQWVRDLMVSRRRTRLWFACAVYCVSLVVVYVFGACAGLAARVVLQPLLLAVACTFFTSASAVDVIDFSTTVSTVSFLVSELPAMYMIIFYGLSFFAVFERSHSSIAVGVDTGQSNDARVISSVCSLPFIAVDSELLVVLCDVADGAVGRRVQRQYALLGDALLKHLVVRELALVRGFPVATVSKFVGEGLSNQCFARAVRRFSLRAPGQLPYVHDAGTKVAATIFEAIVALWYEAMPAATRDDVLWRWLVQVVLPEAGGSFDDVTGTVVWLEKL